MKSLHCPLCGREFQVADNVLAAYCNVGHMTAAYHEGLPAEDGKVYPFGWQAWLESALRICAALAQRITSQAVANFHRHYVAKRSPDDAVWLEFGVHL